MHRRFTDSVADSSQWDNRIATAATASIARLQLWHLARERLLAVSLHIAKGLLDAPDFIRLSLMLTLERRRVENAGTGDVSGGSRVPSAHHRHP
jgi:hypothetical protein